MNEVITFDWGHGGVQYSLKKLTRPKEEFSTWKTYSNRGIVKKSERKVGRAWVILSENGSGAFP